ncbi:hypothetical protein Clacol_010160 [Clathrus columnatus]|uniref:BTB domain-containing protein n=1 Tax=Clathrus columnatus TaxID=1419009 RepID=A0AAV5AQ45_9AGAM|nr:hypothetical protein Clacol_010160 [Clathrus columnatus]
MFDNPPYWHDSGDVFLQVGEEHKFRVHRCVLSMHSLVWKDMFQMKGQSKQPENDLPVVPLNDLVEDVRSLILAFYHGIDDIREKNDLDAALGVLRLSHKYQADRLYKAVFGLLLESWPLNRVDYFSLPQNQRQRVISSIKLIKTARAMQSISLLPTAFYELAATPFEEWTEVGIKLLNDLSSEDLSRLFIGKNRMTIRYKRFTSQLLEECASDPTMPRFRCCSNRTRFVRELTAEFGQSSKLRSEPECLPCGSCRDWLYSHLKTLEIEVWKVIPMYFNLSSVEMGEGPFVRKVFS